MALTKTATQWAADYEAAYATIASTIRAAPSSFEVLPVGSGPVYLLTTQWAIGFEVLILLSRNDDDRITALLLTPNQSSYWIWSKTTAPDASLTNRVAGTVTGADIA